MMTEYEKLEELNKFAELDGTEWGEMIQALYAIFRCREYVSKELADAIDCDINSNYEWASKNLKIVTKTEMVPRNVSVLINLEDEDDDNDDE